MAGLQTSRLRLFGTFHQNSTQAGLKSAGIAQCFRRRPQLFRQRIDIFLASRMGIDSLYIQGDDAYHPTEREILRNGESHRPDIPHTYPPRAVRLGEEIPKARRADA